MSIIKPNFLSAKSTVSADQNVLAVIIEVDGVDPADPAGYIPLEQLTNGTIARVPRWAEYSIDPARPDHLVVSFEQDRAITIIHDAHYAPVDIEEIEVFLSAALLGKDGVAWISYRLVDFDGNPDPAPPRKLTIDHTQVPIQKLAEAKFLDVTLWGYWNITNTQITNGGVVFVPAQTVSRPVDFCELEWRVYKNLNGSGVEVTDAFGRFERTLNDDDKKNGFKTQISFARYIQPLKESGSALVVYRFFNNGRLVGESSPALVRIDLLIPGASKSSQDDGVISSSGFLSHNGVYEMTIEEKVTGDAERAEFGGGVLSLPPVVKNLTVNNRIKKEDADRGYIEVDLDGLTNAGGGGTAQIEVILPDGSVVAGETKSLDGINQPLTFRVPIADIAERTTPEDPTPYKFQFKIFDVDGNDDHSSAPTDIQVRTRGPYATKTPNSRGTVPAVTFTNAPASNVLNSAWFNANPGGLRCKFIDTYAFKHADDIKNMYMGPRSITTSDTPIVSGKLDANDELIIPVDKLRAFGTTSLWDANNIVDLAGYPSVFSAARRLLSVSLPPPLVFFPLEVPDAGTDLSTTLTLKHFNPVVRNIRVILRRPTNAVANADIEVKLEGESLGSKKLGATGGLEFDFTYDVFDAVYGATKGELSAKLTYTYKDGSAPAEDSNQVTTVYLNGDYPPIGLIPPPDLVNENLPPVEVTGVTDQLNHITPADFNGDVTFTFKLWELDLGEPLDRRAVVSFYYNNEFMGDEFIDVGDLSTSITVPFARVAFHGIGTRPAYCDIKYPDVDATVEQKTPTTVRFEATEIDLLPHIARVYNAANPVVSCPALDVVAGAHLWRVAVEKGQAALPAGQDITLHVHGYEDVGLTTPIGVPHTETKPAAVATADTVFDVTLTYLKTLQGPITPPGTDPDYNYIEVWYSTVIAGTTYSSPKRKYRVNVRNTSSKFCDEPA